MNIFTIYKRELRWMERGEYKLKRIVVFFYDGQKDGLIIREITNMIEPIHRYFITRSLDEGEHLQIIFDEKTPNEKIKEFAFHIKTVLKKLKMTHHVDVQYHIEEKDIAIFSMLHEQLQYNQAHYLLDKRYVQSISDYVFSLLYQSQPLLTDMYFYFLLNQVKKEVALPILLHEIAVICKGNKSCNNHLLFSHSYEERLSQENVTFELLFKSNVSNMNRFMGRHSAFIALWINSWKELFHIVEAKLENKNFLIHANEVIFIILYHFLSLLRVGNIERQQYVYMAFRYKEKKSKERQFV